MIGECFECQAEAELVKGTELCAECAITQLEGIAEAVEALFSEYSLITEAEYEALDTRILEAVRNIRLAEGYKVSYEGNILGTLLADIPKLDGFGRDRAQPLIGEG